MRNDAWTRLARGARLGCISVGVCFAGSAIMLGGCEEEGELETAAPIDEQTAFDEEERAIAEGAAGVDAAGFAEGRGEIANVGWQVQRTEAAEGEDPEMVVSMPGPGGGEGLVVRRVQPEEVRAGESVEYSIIVQNASDTVMREIVVKEWRTGAFYVEEAQVLGGSAQHEQMSRGQQTQQEQQTPGQEGQQARLQQARFQDRQSPQRQEQQQPRQQRQEQQGQQPQEQQQEGQQQQGQQEQQGQQSQQDRQAVLMQTAQQQGEQQKQQAQQQQGQQDPNRSHWTIEELQPGESRTIQVTGVAGEEGRFMACMAISYEPTICAVTQVVKPEILVRRQLERDVAFICDDVEVTYLIENVGTGEATDLQLTEELPQGLTTAEGESAVRFNIDTIDPGDTLEQTVTLRAQSAGEYASYASLQGEAVEARTRRETVRFVQPQIELTVDGPQREYVGRNVPVEITVRNTSDVPALETAVRVEGMSELPQASLSTRRAELEGDVIQIGRLDPGESRTMRLMFLADEPRTHSLNVAAEAYCVDAVTEQLVIDVQGVEAVRLETVDMVDPVTVGEETVYEVRVKNQGSAASLNVQVNATLPEEMSFVRGDGDSQVSGQGQKVQLAPIQRLEPGAIATWRIVARAQRPGKTQLQLELTSDATRQPALEQEPTTILPAAGQGQQGENQGEPGQQEGGAGEMEQEDFFDGEGG